MADNIGDVLQELSGLLRRIAEQKKDSNGSQIDDAGADALKNIELLARGREQDGAQGDRFRSSAIQTLRDQHHRLESLIARLQEKNEKGQT
jgi:hypothetical protein